MGVFSSIKGNKVFLFDDIFVIKLKGVFRESEDINRPVFLNDKKKRFI